MKRLLLNWIFTAISLLLVDYLLDDIKISGIAVALIASVVLGLVNTFIRPVVKFITIPFNIFTLGLFTFVINALMYKLTSMFVTGFEVKTFVAALIGAILTSVFTSVLNFFFRR